MVFLEKQALCDISEMLMDLRRVVAAHGEFLAKFGQRTLTEEPPDSPDERSPPHQPWNTRPPDQQPATGPQRGWSLPPSVTTAPLGIKPETLPRLRLEPPRFDGENAPYWIRKIQTYYNHHYTPLDDRLYLTQYLFDHPASDWREYWVETNKGKGWDDFLLAVKQRFDPDPYADNAGPVRKPHTSTPDLLAWSEDPSPEVPWAATAARANYSAEDAGKVIFDEEIRASLVELHRLIKTQEKSIMPAKFGQRALTEKASNSLYASAPKLPMTVSSTRTWRPPSSRTTGEFVPTRIQTEAPLFNGDDPLGWIFGIQDYFNYF